MLKTVKVLSPKECESVISKINNLRNYVIKSSTPGISTLGAASYLHGDIYLHKDKDIDFCNPIGSDRDFVENEIIVKDDDLNYYPLHLINYDKNPVSNNISSCDLYSENEIMIYHHIKKITNPLLFDNFKDIFEKICYILENELQEKCLINDEAKLAYPGFNIFSPYEHCNMIDCPPHIDLQWTYHLYELKNIFDTVSENDVITFTLSIKLPKSGGGLYIWPPNSEKDISTYRNAKQFYEKTITKCKTLLKNNKLLDKNIFEKILQPTFIEYSEGSMFIFNNLLLHQVAPFNIPFDINEERITLQGHGIKCDGIWRLFF